MPRGGARPGAGRPKGSKNRPATMPEGALSAPAVPEGGALTPLEYMLAVMNDATQLPERRDRMAQAAAAYVHTKSAEAIPGKREQANQAAQEAARGRFAPRQPPKLVVNNG